MGNTEETDIWRPVAPTERYTALDVTRGLALLGVLLVNLVDDFRVSLAEHILTFHTHSAWMDRAVEGQKGAIHHFGQATRRRRVFAPQCRNSRRKRPLRLRIRRRPDD